MSGTLGPSQANHVLARTGFGPYPGQIQEALARHDTVDSLIEERSKSVLAFAPRLDDPDLPDGGVVDIDQPDAPGLAYHMRFREWWLKRMLDPAAALHERMMWFWHGRFTTSSAKVDSTNLCWRQLRTLHQHSLGNFRDLARALTIDGAMLRYLDGDGSWAAAPNENYAREFMELFTIGFDRFSQDDVAAGALALAGWKVEEDLHVEFHADRALQRPVSMLGVSGIRNVDDLVDAVLSSDDCAPFVVTGVWQAFIGPEPDDRMVARWARSFRRSGYEIAPLMDEVLHSSSFLESANQRTRSPIEWYCAAHAITEAPELNTTDVFELGQAPYLPPSVAGWPADPTWRSATQVRARALLLARLPVPAGLKVEASDDPVGFVIDRCSLIDVSESTRSALVGLDTEMRAIADVPPGARGKALLAVALLSPEFAER